MPLRGPWPAGDDEADSANKSKPPVGASCERYSGHPLHPSPSISRRGRLKAVRRGGDNDAQGWGTAARRAKDGGAQGRWERATAARRAESAFGPLSGFWC
ncbi:hypothetical protein GQ55_2G458700 [Panicum hallii var. hallii]|uniref:Uncharacterized protein n=1 Tax=Panicum hallii var. hallii TaxID=1504633 RepID=A0A2T7EZJ6_9POAL|nr:hypothetical protein GQ55_2G458700 [Panicum hallii var. hallii]